MVRRNSWSSYEDSCLREAVETLGHSWARVGRFPGLERRSPHACRFRWQQLQSVYRGVPTR